MKLVSWNVNGLRAVLKKGFEDIVRDIDPDIIGIQETKMQEGQATLDLPAYTENWSFALKKGYSGTAVFSKTEPLQVWHGFSAKAADEEGRVCALEFEDFWFVCIYTPNAQPELARIEFRLDFEKRLRAFVKKLQKSKPVILCGDLNVAHNEIDLKNPGPNRGNAGFSDEERGAFEKLLDCGLIDTFRTLHPDEAGKYSWWSYRMNARANNAGWRIDYFLASEALRKRIRKAEIYADVYGSDHCPVALELKD